MGLLCNCPTGAACYASADVREPNLTTFALADTVELMQKGGLKFLYPGWVPKEDEQALALGEIEFFSGLDAASIAELAGAVREISIPATGRICSRGNAGDDIFFVRRGRVNAPLPLEGGKRYHLATFCQGDFFGEMAFLDREPQSADIGAVTATDLCVLSRERFDALVKTNPALGGKLFEQLAYAVSKRLRVADTELRVLEQR